jgi:hypothetical protein
MRRVLALLLAALACSFVAAQPAGTPQEPQPRGRPDPKIERIRVEDAGSRVDELRVGGQTQTITVQPKVGGAEYEVLSTDGVRGHPVTREGAGSGGGARVWNVLRF